MASADTGAGDVIGAEGVTDAAALLRALGQRVTAPRLAVLEAILADRDQHLTAEVVHARVAAAKGEAAVHRTTVYRTLDALIRAGVLRHVHLDHGVTAYHVAHADAVEPAHLHAQCATCGRVVDLPRDVLGDLPARVRRASGFALDAGHVAFSGHCADCAPHDH